ncbi:hypothetical protein HK102_006781 [Quaeritorhiza haematococci]|nr:hypothetical protein HK102_006781 [Quaeritorhiza haematococci]
MNPGRRRRYGVRRGAKGLLELALTEDSHRVVPILLKTLDCPDKLIMAAMEEEGKERVKSRENRTEIVKALLSHKGENMSNRKGTLLGLAVDQANADLVSFLLESDANLDVPDQSIITAAEQSQTEVVKPLWKRKGKSSTIKWDNHQNRDEFRKQGFELVKAAARDGHTEIVELFFTNMGRNVDALRGHILTVAAISGLDNIVGFLLENDTFYQGTTAREEALVAIPPWLP